MSDQNSSGGSQQNDSGESIADKVKRVTDPDGLIGRRGNSVQRTNEREASGLRNYPDPAVYDADRKIVGYVQANGDGTFSAMTQNSQIAGSYPSRKEAEDKVWQAHLKSNPNAKQFGS